MLRLLSVLVLVLTFGVGNVWGADQTVTWTINGVNNATSSGGQNVNTTLKTSSKSPTSETGVWTAIASSSYASSNSGAQFGSGGYTFAGTITLSGTSIPSTATIKSVTLRCTTNGTAYKVNASVSNNTFGSQVTLNSSSATNYTFTGSQVLGTGGNIVLTFSSGGKKNFVVKSLSVTYEEAPSYTINAQSNNTSKGTVSLSGTTITATPKSGYRVSTNEPYAIAPANSATVTQDGNTFTVTPSANTTITINFEEIPTHTVTWSANGNTSNTSIVAEGAAISFPESASGCTGKTFMGWTATPIVGETNDEPTYVSSANMGTSDITFYAVFADEDEGEGTIEVTDLITASTLAATGTTYTAFSGVNGSNSDAVYAGKSSKNGSDVQLNSTSPNGIVSTKSGGKVKSVVIVWSSNATDSRTVDIYGNNSAYSTAADLYNISTDGDKVGSIVYTSKTNNATTYTFTSDYDYVGIRMYSGATRMVSISITWTTTGGTTYSNYATSCCTELGSINGSVSVTNQTVSWSAVTDASGYKVKVGTGDWSDIGNVTSKTFDLPCGGDTYNVYVMAYNNDNAGHCTGDGPASEAIQVTSAACTEPEIIVDPTSLTGLNYIVGVGPCAAQSFDVLGANLTGDLTVKANDNYEICLTNSATAADWKSGNTTLTIAKATAENGQKVYVRLKSGKTVGDYNSNTIKVYGGGVLEANAATVTVSGSVLKPTISVDPTSITGWNAQTGNAPSPATKTISVTGTNLKANVSVTLTAGSDYFTITPESLTQTSGSASGTITIGVKEAAYASAGTPSGTLRLSTTDGDNVEVSISLTVADDSREKFTLLTSSNLNQLSNGAKLVLVYDDYDILEETHDYYVMTTTQNSSNGHEQTNTGFEIETNVLAIADNNPQSIQVLELVETGKNSSDEDTYALYTGSTKNTYLYNSANNKFNETSSYTENSAKWTISVSDGYAIIDAQGGNNQQIGFNSTASGAKFRCYNSGYSIYAYFQPSTTPSIKVTPSSLTGFTYVKGNGPSEAQNFSVSGMNRNSQMRSIHV